MIGAAVVLFGAIYPISCLIHPLIMTDTHGISAQRDVQGIINAIKLYETQYAILPRAPDSVDKSIPTTRPLIDVLTGADTNGNPRSIPFIEAKQAHAASGHKPARGGLIDHGKGSKSLVDPWGNHYMVRIDYDDDGLIDAPDGGKPIAVRIICWSFGKPSDRKDYQSALKNRPKDWIKSW